MINKTKLLAPTTDINCFEYNFFTNPFPNHHLEDIPYPFKTYSCILSRNLYSLVLSTPSRHESHISDCIANLKKQECIKWNIELKMIAVVSPKGLAPDGVDIIEAVVQ